MAYKVLILGASYGSLLATKLLFGGHTVKLVCLPAEAEAINKEGCEQRSRAGPPIFAYLAPPPFCEVP